MKNHLLIMRFSALGDVAMTVPVVWSLAKQHPDLRITILSRGFARTLFDGLAPNISFMEADFKHENKGIHGLNVLFRRLKAKNFTHVADLHDVLRSKYLRMRFDLSMTKVEHIDKHRRERRRLTAQADNRILKPIPTAFSNYAEVFEKLGFPVSNDFSSIFADNDTIAALLPEALGKKGDGERWVGIAPFAAHKGKMLPIDKVESIVEHLCRRADMRVMVFCGGAEERKIADRWSSQWSNCTNASALATSLKQEIAIMSRLNVMLSMDSANMHLASLAATQVVSVWGATHPFAGFMGWKQDDDNAVQKDMPCRPCSIYGNKPCSRGDYACLNDIDTDMIIQKIEKYL